MHSRVKILRKFAIETFKRHKLSILAKKKNPIKIFGKKKIKNNSCNYCLANDM